MTSPASNDVDTPVGQLPIQQLLPAVYQDALAPGVKQIGVALESVLGLVPTLMLPLRYINEAAKLLLTQRLEKLRHRLQNQTVTDTTSIPAEIGVPVVEKLMYVRDDALAELYVQLLASAGNKNTESTAHPSFVHLIANLSPDEAALLQLFHDPDTPITWPYVNVNLVQNGTTNLITLRGPLLGWEKLIRLQFPDNIPAYVGNLTRCGFLRDEASTLKIFHPGATFDSNYWVLERLYRDGFGQPMRADTKIEFSRGTVSLTELGRLFIRCCVVARPDVFTGEKIDDSL
jgi:Abortive infection alpha